MLTPCLGGGTIKSLNVNEWTPPPMQQQSVFRYTFQEKHLRTRPRKTTDIFVSAGSFSDPHYTFADKKGKAIKSFELDPSKQYRFKRADKASTHPFYISDQGWNQPATKKSRSNEMETSTRESSTQRNSPYPSKRSIRTTSQLRGACSSTAQATDRWSAN